MGTSQVIRGLVILTPKPSTPLHLGREERPKVALITNGQWNLHKKPKDRVPRTSGLGNTSGRIVHHNSTKTEASKLRTAQPSLYVLHHLQPLLNPLWNTGKCFPGLCKPSNKWSDSSRRSWESPIHSWMVRRTANNLYLGLAAEEEAVLCGWALNLLDLTLTQVNSVRIELNCRTSSWYRIGQWGKTTNPPGVSEVLRVALNIEKISLFVIYSDQVPKDPPQPQHADSHSLVWPKLFDEMVLPQLLTPKHSLCTQKSYNNL